MRVSRTRRQLQRRRWAQHALVLAVALLTVSVGMDYVRPQSAEATDETVLALRPVVPMGTTTAPGLPGFSNPSQPPPLLEPEDTAENGPVVTSRTPAWLRSEKATALWASYEARSDSFTDLPVGSLLHVEGPQRDGRWPVYYGGDGKLRLPGTAWVDAAATTPIEAPPPGAMAEVDAYAVRPLPTWVQAHRATTLWSGPDAGAVEFSELPQWSYLRVTGVLSGKRLLVQYAGDYATRQAGIGWVDESAVGPSEDPGRWVQAFKATALWSGADGDAQRFTDLPQWSSIRVLDDSRPSAERILVEYAGDGRTRAPGAAWVPRGDVGPITPPSPLPARPNAASSNAAASPGSQRVIESRTFSSESDFIDTIGTAAQRSQRTTGVPASVTVAQAILESDWGRSGLSRRANNLFGIKALGGPGPAGTLTLPTWEYLNGQDVVVQAAFKAYYTLDESVDDHGRFFVRNRRYAPALAVASDARAFARGIQEAGYATDPGYAAKLTRLMDRYNLYRFDPS